MVLICCSNCSYCEKNKSKNLDNSLYFCINKNKEINNRFIEFCVKFKYGGYR